MIFVDQVAYTSEARRPGLLVCYISHAGGAAPALTLTIMLLSNYALIYPTSLSALN